MVEELHNLKANLEELRRQFFGVKSEKTSPKPASKEETKTVPVKAHSRQRKPKATRDELYANLPIREILCPVKESERLLLCCSAHARRKFYEALPAEKKKSIRLLDINSPQAIKEPEIPQEDLDQYIPAEIGVAYFNKLFYLEREVKDLSPKERKAKRMEQEVPVWENFFTWLETLNPVKGCKLEKAVNYALNHKDTLRNYLQDGRCELSNNCAERKAKSYAIGRKNSLFHTCVDGAVASSIIYSLVETAKANNLNVFQYIYTLLLYMPGCKDRSEGIEQLLPWSDFIKEHCSGLIDVENVTVENHPQLPV